MTEALSTLCNNNNAVEQEQKILNQLFEVINRVDESIDRVEQVQRSQAWTHQQLTKLGYEIK